MSENLNINGYVCANNDIYTTLKAANLTSDKLQALDKNSDNKISEDELMEFTGEDDTVSGTATVYSDNPTINSLQMQYEKQMREIYRLQQKISHLRTLKSETKANMAQFAEDSEERSGLESKMDEIQGKIDSYNSSVTSGISNLFSINMQIQNAQNNLNSTGSTASAVMSNGVNATSATASGTLEVNKGSGASLATVTGDLSTCLDRVAQSLGTSRSDAADYITTLCNTVGKGYFNPKVILSQIFSESSGNQSCSTTSTSKYVGLGQMSAVAVEEVNKQFGTNFTFNDMNNAAKNLKAMVYLMTYQYERYGKNLGAALTAYNVGHYSGSVNNYAQKIMSRV